MKYSGLHITDWFPLHSAGQHLDSPAVDQTVCWFIHPLLLPRRTTLPTFVPVGENKQSLDVLSFSPESSGRGMCLDTGGVAPEKEERLILRCVCVCVW